MQKSPSRPISSNEGVLKWFEIDTLAENMPKMPFTAHYVVEHYIKTGRKTDAVYAGIAAESGVSFTEMTEF